MFTTVLARMMEVMSARMATKQKWLAAGRTMFNQQT